MQRAVFLDRDGVIIRDIGLLTERAQVELYDYTPEAIRRLKKAGFVVIVVTNQTVISRGLSTEAEVSAIHDWLQHLLGETAQIDRFYFCPHHPNATLQDYRMVCECRKPRPGMLLQAAREMNLDLAKSYMIGDRVSDIAAGARAGCQTILVQTGMHTAPPIQTADGTPIVAEPDHVCADLAAAAEIILNGV